MDITWLLSLVDAQTLVAVGTVATFGAVALLVGAAQSAFADRRDLNRSLRTVRSIDLETSDDVRKKALAAPVTERLIGPAMRRLAAFGRRFTPAGTVERLREELEHAGSPPGWDAGRILAMKALLPAAFGGGGLLLTTVAGLGGLRAIVVAVAGGFVGWYLPEWILRSRSGARQDEVQRQMPDSLDLLGITVQAGLGFDAALAKVSREVGGPLGEELHRVVQEIQLGEGRVEALRSLARRNPVPEVKSFVLAMAQADQLGIAVSNVLEIQADELRRKRRQRAEEKAQKLPVKIVFPLILCIFPALFVVLLGPAAIQIWETVFQMGP